MHYWYYRKWKYSKRASSRRQLSFSEQDKNMICELCHRRNSQLSSPSAWRDEQARTYVLSLKVPLACYICCLCRDDVTRILANPSHVPRWKKGKNSSNSSNCCVLGCSSVSLSAVSSTFQDELQHAFQRMGLQCSSEVIPTPTPLWKYHYHLVYSSLYSPGNVQPVVYDREGITTIHAQNRVLLEKP